MVGQGIMVGADMVRITGESLLATAWYYVQVKFILAGSCLPQGLANFLFCFFCWHRNYPKHTPGVSGLHLRDCLFGKENKEQHICCPVDLHLGFYLEILD